MKTRRSAARRKATSGPGILLRYRDVDTAYGVSRRTAKKLADTLGLSETQVIHVALAQFARQNLPQYEPDDGPLTPEQMEEIRRLQPPGRMKTRESLF
ncbi:MAG TPA: hypothetical protein VKF40_07105 [Burkholderiales bacterium]|nr:hypothetical protein [Burkholderiales bacterium]